MLSQGREGPECALELCSFSFRLPESWEPARVQLQESPWVVSRKNMKTVRVSKLQIKEQTCLWTYVLESLIDIPNPSRWSIFLLNSWDACVVFFVVVVIFLSLLGIRIEWKKWVHCYGLNRWYLSMFLVPFLTCRSQRRPIQLKIFQVYELRNLCDFIVHLPHFIVEAKEAQRGEEFHPGSHSKPGQEPQNSDSPSNGHSKSVPASLAFGSKVRFH